MKLFFRNSVRKTKKRNQEKLIRKRRKKIKKAKRAKMQKKILMQKRMK